MRLLLLVSFVVVVAFFPSQLAGQWLNYSAPGIPRTPDGKPNLSAPEGSPYHRAVPAARLWAYGPASHDRRSEDIHQAMDAYARRRVDSR